MTASPTAAPHTESRLAHFPITFYATTMGFGGLTLALRAAAKPLGLGPLPYQVMLGVTATAFVLISLFYLAKALTHWKEVYAEWHHPIRLSFFPTISVSMLLLSIGLMTVSQPAALALWGVGTTLQGILTIAVVTNWIGTRSFQHGHLNPAWFIPAVGNVIVPVAGAQLGFTEISWLFFSAGMMFWVILLTLVFNRLVFHDPLPGRLQPTLVIMIAPPAVAFISWVRLTMGEGAEVDAMGHIMLSLAYVFAALVAVQLPRILRLPFAMSFWALSFPVAALTIATLLYAELSHSMVHQYMGTGFLGLLVVLIAGLVVRTLLGIVRGEICKPE
ncbi:tellurite resistance protein [Rhodobacter aestuarii]|uniref:Tellurite resistance protein n=1 Tax=Rhodobacter aestuarii TaxID=453582 RepID=A0A1N7M583_9RHOB|nr:MULTISPECIES: SLAC1 anion channel family protein [Rhodobacter]PTV94848.1 tellurite resistance protein [Rhodobacter aestuarii]SIS81139.1 tellurite resistance protein [Rhodobacter aestuarii]SOC14153.1 tellurite resistance protein [Rhodobacter sp. JA431]